MRRPALAFLVAPLAAPALYWLWRLVEGLAGGPDRRHQVLQAPLRELAVVLAFGAPIAYAAAAAVAIPFRWLLHRGTAAARVAIVLAGGATGLATALVLGPALRGDIVGVVLTPVQGACLGAAAATLFQWIALRGAPPPPAAGPLSAGRG